MGESIGPMACKERDIVFWKSEERQDVIKNFYKEKKRFLDSNAHFLTKMEGKR